jgi:hypothetical protein
LPSGIGPEGKGLFAFMDKVCEAGRGSLIINKEKCKVENGSSCDRTLRFSSGTFFILHFNAV